VADKAPESLRSIKPWAAPAVKFLPEDGPNGLSRGIRRSWAFFSNLLRAEEN